MAEETRGPGREFVEEARGRQLPAFERVGPTRRQDCPLLPVSLRLGGRRRPRSRDRGGPLDSPHAGGVRELTYPGERDMVEARAAAIRQGSAGCAGRAAVLNFYLIGVSADQLRRGRKTATIRLGDKSHKYRKNDCVLVTIGYQHSPREKDSPGGHRPGRGQARPGSPLREIVSTTTRSSGRVDELVHFTGADLPGARSRWTTPSASSCVLLADHRAGQPEQPPRPHPRSPAALRN